VKTAQNTLTQFQLLVWRRGVSSILYGSDEKFTKDVERWQEQTYQVHTHTDIDTDRLTREKERDSGRQAHRQTDSHTSTLTYTPERKIKVDY